MKTLRRLIYGEVFSAVSFVALGFLGLFFFFDLVDELKWIGQGPGNAYAVRHALAYWAKLGIRRMDDKPLQGYVRRASKAWKKTPTRTE